MTYPARTDALKYFTIISPMQGPGAHMVICGGVNHACPSGTTGFGVDNPQHALAESGRIAIWEKSNCGVLNPLLVAMPTMAIP